MTRFTYERKMAWATFWIFILGVWQRVYTPKYIGGSYAWVISQCGFAYAGTWEMAKDIV